MEQPSVGLNYQGKPRTCGLRFSLLDGIVLFSSIVIGVFGYPYLDGFVLFIPFVVVHFFLFCNVFRIRRKPELIWAGLFILVTAAWIGSGHLSILGICGTQVPVTIAIIANELRVPTYHGIFSRHINPRIDEYTSRGEN